MYICGFSGCSWDELDLASGINFEITNPPNKIHALASNAPLQPPIDRSYCGSIYGIIYTGPASQHATEKLKNNNFGVDVVRLMCNRDGMWSIHVD
jgi:hypothetical protein